MNKHPWKHPWYHPTAVAITGFARAGKDSCGNVLVDFGYTPVALAGPLKELAFRADYYMPRQGVLLSTVIAMHGWEEAKNRYPEVREYLVALGTAGRMVFAEGEDFWISQALARAGSYPVFTDVRFHNEAAAIRRQYPGAFFVRVERPGLSASSGFENEVPDIQVDQVVHNDGDLDDLAFKVKDAFVDHLATVETAQQTLSFAR